MSTQRRGGARDARTAAVRNIDSIAYELRDTYRALARIFDMDANRFGITMGMWMFLRALWREDGLTQKELIQCAGLLQAGTSAALKQLEKCGLITQTVDSEDRRKTRVHLTARARAMLSKLVPIAASVRDRATQDFSAREVTLLVSMLGRIRTNLGEPGTQAKPTAKPEAKPRARRAATSRGRPR